MTSLSLPEKPDIRRAQYEAFLLTKEFAITRAEEIVLPEIAMALGIYVREDILSGAEARLIRNGNRGVIRINASIPQLGRKRFAVAHELGHWRLHDMLLQVCTEEDLRGLSSKAIEAEANAFSGAFLMPTQLFSPLCRDEQPDIALICELADQFTTTVTATALRFVDECRYPCAVVFSENRKISWWKTAKACPIWLENGWDIDPESSAWDVQPLDKRHRVNRGYWLPDPARAKDLVLFEQSIVLGQYGVLTLLSVEDRLI